MKPVDIPKRRLASLSKAIGQCGPQAMRKCMKSERSSNFGQIRSPTAELAWKSQHRHITGGMLWPFKLGSSSFLQASTYGKCVSVKAEVTKNVCSKEFEALIKCVKQASKKV